MAAWFVLGLFTGIILGIGFVKALVFIAGELVHKIELEQECLERLWRCVQDEREKLAIERTELDVVKVIKKFGIEMEVVHGNPYNERR